MLTNNEKNLEINKLTDEQLFELSERQTNLLKNKKLLDKLPDKGKQLRKNIEKVDKEIQLRGNIKTIEAAMNTLSVQDDKEMNHVEHICNMEKTPTKERYKPFATVKNKQTNKLEKGTQLIPLKQSIDLLTEQKRFKDEQMNARSDGEDGDTSDEENQVEPILYP